MKNWPANYLEMPQRSKEWFDIRLGCPTSSRIADAIGMLTRKSGDKQAGGPTAARERFQMEMADEIISREPSEHYVSVYMEKGIEDEPLALEAYELTYDVVCERIGFVLHPRIKMAGASPDALIGEDGGLEVKCPKRTTHYRYLIDGVVPKLYRPQLYWLMACTERPWWDFMSYCKEVPRELRQFVVRLQRDDKEIVRMEAEVEKCNAEIAEIVAKIRSRGSLVETLKESIRNARGSYPTDEELGITEQDVRA